MRIFFERKKKRLIFKEFAAVDSVKKNAGKIKEKGISIQMRIQKIKGKRFFYTTLVKKKSHSAGDVPGKESDSTEKFDFTKYT